MKVSLCLALSFSCCLLASGLAFSAPAKVYKWTDKKGLVHYSERPPLGVQTELVKPEIGHSEPVNYDSVKTEKPKEEKKVASTQSLLKDPERCEVARQNLEKLKTYVRIRIKDENGEYRFLTPEELTQKTNEATIAIKESCG